MQLRTRHIVYILLAISICTCKTPYTPAPITAVTNYLVVEGLINISDSTFIHLSRTVNISAATAIKPELKATITIEDNKGGSYALKEVGNGLYSAPSYTLIASNQYRLRIKTFNKNTYTSDFVPAVVSPPIDSVNWKATNAALNIYVNTHDPNNATHYYRWDYTEEWVFHTDYDSYYVVSNGKGVVLRDPAKHVYQCFGSDSSHVITIGSSAQLTRDLISGQLINTIPSTAEKIGTKYSIQVTQYALTEDAYNYWALLKKNTEQLGSIFDAQPSASIGNIHNLNIPTEVVIGYIGAGTITTNRIFITKSQLPNWITMSAYPIGVTNSPQCTLDSGFAGGPQIPIDYVAPIIVNGKVVNTPGYTAADPLCVDCTLRGTTTQPAYWK